MNEFERLRFENNKTRERHEKNRLAREKKDKKRYGGLTMSFWIAGFIFLAVHATQMVNSFDIDFIKI